jgi:hypothetical protein
MALADANTTAAALSGISLVVAIIAVLISLISLYRSHLAPFKVITAAGDLSLRIYRIKNGKDSWYIASADIPPASRKFRCAHWPNTSLPTSRLIPVNFYSRCVRDF